MHTDPVRKVLVLQTAFAGDVVLVTPLARGIKQTYPEAEIHFLVIPQTAVLLNNNPFITKVWIFDKKKQDRRFLALLPWMKKLRNEHFDVAVVPHRSFRSALLVRGAKIPRRIGFDKSAGSFLFTDIVSYPTDIHEVDRNFKLIRILGISAPAGSPELFPGEAERNEATLFLKEAGIRPDQKMIAMAPGSIWPTKRWHPDGFTQVARRLWVEREIPTILIGGENDLELGNQIVLKAGEGTVNGIGKFSLLTSAELIRQCCAIVTNDSAPLHLGIAMGTSVVAIFGPTVPAFGFGPYGDGHTIIQKEMDCRPCGIHGGTRCPKGHFNCMQEISGQDVFLALEEYLKECQREL